jgi:SAM-dependent methyltransferase
MTLPSEFDNAHFPLSRAFIDEMRLLFVRECLGPGYLVCDVGNQGKDLPDLNGAKVVTLDITASTHPDIVADITRENSNIGVGRFDALMCTEVLEHVVDPVSAIREICRIVKPGGFILFTAPLNARIHGPVPDCWRFTEFGWKVLLRDFDTLHFRKLDTPGRNLFPLHYGAIVRNRSGSEESDPRGLTFSRVD